MAFPTAVAETDRALIAGCRVNDPAAQRALFDRYRDRVYGIAFHYLKGDADAAQDVAQEVFVRFFRSVAQFREEASLTTYLYRAVANACTDELRKRRRFVFFGDVDALDAVLATDHATPQATDAPEATLDDPRVRAALQTLSPKLRLVILMRYFDDLSYEEIAAALQTTMGTVASRLNRAHAHLAHALAPLRAERHAGT